MHKKQTNQEWQVVSQGMPLVSFTKNSTVRKIMLLRVCIFVCLNRFRAVVYISRGHLPTKSNSNELRRRNWNERTNLPANTHTNTDYTSCG